MFERIAIGWELAKQALGILRLDKEMLVFPLCSGIACMLVLASFGLPLMGSEYAQVIQEDGQAPQDPLAYVILFLFYFVNYFVIIFFNSALVACAIIRLKGGDPTVGDGFRAAFARLPQILGWALVSATVGVILKAIENRSEKAGAIISGLLGIAWSAMTYFVVPVLVVEKVGPIDAVKRSASILRKTWGEALVSNMGIGLIVFFASLVALIPLGIGILLANTTAIVIGAVISVVMIIVISLVSSALSTIITAALYDYAAEGVSPSNFDNRLLRDAFTHR